MRLGLGIRYKIFLTLLLAIVTVMAGSFLLMQWSFDRGLLAYINRDERQRIQRLVAELTRHYRIHGSWRLMQEDDAAWRELLRSGLSRSGNESAGGDGREEPRWRPDRPPPRPRWRPGHPPPGFDPYAPEGMGGPPPHARPPPAPFAFEGAADWRTEGSNRPPPGPPGRPPQGPAEPLERRVALLDAERQPLRSADSGDDDDGVGLQLYPLQRDDQVVGYLAVRPVAQLLQVHDLQFLDSQSRTFLWLSFGMFVVAVLFAIPVSWYIARRIRALKQATQRLLAGDYGIQLRVGGGDELARLADDFNQLAATLEQTERARRQWVADTAHELRTPISVLRGEIEAIQDGVRQAGPDGFASLHGEVMQLTRLVEDLYQLSLADAGALSYRMVELDLVELLQSCCQRIGGALSGKGLTLETPHWPSGEIRLVGDEARLTQVFDNLFTNSLRYTDAGGVIVLTLSLQAGQVRVLLEDSPPGVADEDLPRLFQRLYRSDKSRSRRYGGAGLGLALCAKMVAAHGGEIRADHSRWGGVAMEVSLPMLED